MYISVPRGVLLVLGVFYVLTIYSLLGLAVQAQEPIKITETDESFTGLYPVESILAEDGDVPGDFVVGPGKVDLTISPGQSKTIEMTVTNRTGERKRFDITTEDIAGSQDEKTSAVLLGEDRGPYSLRDYITVPHRVVDLEHNQRARIPVTISVPTNAEAGGLYGTVLVKTIAIEAKAGTQGSVAPQSAIIARIGTLFFITIPGDIERDGFLKDFTTVPQREFFQGGPIPFGILFENRGSIHLAPRGEIRVKNFFNEEVGIIQLDPWFVLPKSLRLREVSWEREFLFGRYTATAYISRSYDDLIDEKSFTFWVLPWKPFVITFAVLFAIFFTIRAFFRKFEFKRKL